ncbi:MAG: shikimate kinase [Firmicutes bacterium]|nr:shikimate kinase [Bacillota bacterium]
MHPQNVILIGMPGAGKSTIGVLLAKTLGKTFVDTDLLIQAQEGKLLQELIDEYGIDHFLEIEAAVIAGLKIDNAVIATGGSAIYSDQAVNHLKQNGIAVYLQLTYEEIGQRIKNMASRGVVIGAGQSLLDLYRERVPKYESHADLVIDCSGKSIEEAVQIIAEKIRRFNL